MLIQSTKNAQVKRLRSLYKDKKLRIQEGMFVCEGVNLVKDIPSNIIVSQLFIKQSEYDKLSFIETNLKQEANILPDGIFDSVCDTITPSGVIAVVEKPENKAITGEIILLLCGISDSGNLGTILRTASAIGIDDIILMDCCDVFSPKTVRASMGGVFYLNIIECTTISVDAYLNGYDIISLDMGGESIHSYKREGKIALAVGSEAHGVADFIKEKSKKIICLPMLDGRVESLNAAVSAGIAMYMIK
jgi:TrmH family RNA methyltransferase